jgi:hypothetical protein
MARDGGPWHPTARYRPAARARRRARLARRAGVRGRGRRGRPGRRRGPRRDRQEPVAAGHARPRAGGGPACADRARDGARARVPVRRRAAAVRAVARRPGCLGASFRRRGSGGEHGVRGAGVRRRRVRRQRFVRRLARPVLADREPGRRGSDRAAGRRPALGRRALAALPVLPDPAARGPAGAGGRRGPRGRAGRRARAAGRPGDRSVDARDQPRPAQH